jgi:SepF-like predicted cell division protein (DUF552 family)
MFKQSVLLERISDSKDFRVVMLEKNDEGYMSVYDILEYHDINELAKYVDKFYGDVVDLAPIHANVKFDSRVKKIGTKLKKIAETL